MPARLLDVSSPNQPVAVVLVLHGGASRGERMMVSPAQLSVLRMVPIARRTARRGRGDFAVLRLLNTHRGWDTHHTPVADVEWALAEVAERYGDKPVGLIGHSLGGRAALLAGSAPAVRSVVALAPWVYPDDRADLTGRVLIVHGDHDRIARARHSERVAANLGSGARVTYITVAGGKHAMLHRHRDFDGLAADFTSAALLGTSPDRGPVSRAFAGETFFTI